MHIDVASSSPEIKCYIIYAWAKFTTPLNINDTEFYLVLMNDCIRCEHAPTRKHSCDSKQAVMTYSAERASKIKIYSDDDLSFARKFIYALALCVRISARRQA